MRDRKFISAMTPEQATHYALEVDRGPSGDTRRAASRDPKWAYYYADTVDRKVNPVTRAGVNQNPVFKAYYLQYVDNRGDDNLDPKPVPAYTHSLGD